MSVLDGKPAYPNSRPDFQRTAKPLSEIRAEDGALLVKNPYGGNTVVITERSIPFVPTQSPYC